MWTESADPRLLAEIRHLEVALGRTAKARLGLRWRIIDGGESSGPRPTDTSPRRMRVTD